MTTASWSRQNVLARVGTSVIHYFEYCLLVSPVNKVCQNNSWYVGTITAFLFVHISIRWQDQIKRHNREGQKHTYTLLLVPRISILVSRILEEEGVLGDVTISAFNLQFIPIAEDVISLESDSAFKELWAVRIAILAIVLLEFT